MRSSDVRAKVFEDGSVLLDGTPEEIAAYRKGIKQIISEPTFQSFDERDGKRHDDPADDGPIVPPDQPLVLED